MFVALSSFLHFFFLSHFEFLYSPFFFHTSGRKKKLLNNIHSCRVYLHNRSPSENDNIFQLKNQTVEVTVTDRDERERWSLVCVWIASTYRKWLYKALGSERVWEIINWNQVEIMMIKNTKVAFNGWSFFGFCYSLTGADKRAYRFKRKKKLTFHSVLVLRSFTVIAFSFMSNIHCGS